MLYMSRFGWSGYMHIILNAFHERFWLFWVGFLLCAPMAVLTMTPFAWNAMGQPDEMYPEIFFAFFGLVPSLPFLLFGLAIAIYGGRANGGLFQRRLGWIWLGAVANCVFVVGTVLVALASVGLNLEIQAFGYLPFGPLFLLPLAAISVVWPKIVEDYDKSHGREEL